MLNLTQQFRKYQGTPEVMIAAVRMARSAMMADLVEFLCSESDRRDVFSRLAVAVSKARDIQALQNEFPESDDYNPIDGGELPTEFTVGEEHFDD